MIKTTLIYFILDKCLDKIEQMVVYNITEPEKRKLTRKITFLDSDKWIPVRKNNITTYKLIK